MEGWVSVSDAGRMLEIVALLPRIQDPRPFPPILLEQLRTLIPCDVVVYHDRRIGSPGLTKTGPHIKLPDHIGPAYEELRATDPLRYRASLVGQPVAFGDFYSRRQLMSTGLWSEVARPSGINDMLVLWLPTQPGRMRGFNFDTGDREFSERDRAVLRLLYPYLLDAARAREQQTAASPAGQSLSAREREVLAELARGRTSRGIGEALGISSRTVDKHLERIFEKLGVRTRAAAVAIAMGSGPSVQS